MAEKLPQTYANHVRWHPPFHFFLMPCAIAVLIMSIVNKHAKKFIRNRKKRASVGRPNKRRVWKRKCGWNRFSKNR